MERLIECQQLAEDGNRDQSGGVSTYYGMLTVRVYFSNECLFVEILSAKDVVPLDNNGKVNNKSCGYLDILHQLCSKCSILEVTKM